MYLSKYAYGSTVSSVYVNITYDINRLGDKRGGPDGDPTINF